MNTADRKNEVIKLWPMGAPGSESWTQVEEETILPPSLVEIHIYSKGGHGFGMTHQGLPSDNWIELFEDWLKVQGLLKRPS